MTRNNNFSSSMMTLDSQVSSLVESSRSLRRQANEARQRIEGLTRSLESLDVQGVMIGMRRFAEIARTGR